MLVLARFYDAKSLLVLQRAMQGFTEKIVGMMKSEKLFESQGGPIILSQVLISSFHFLFGKIINGHKKLAVLIFRNIALIQANDIGF